ncbi:hypothetical protein FH972_027248 [Carpinus fangiana]|uniref:Uncharacterized protein n=1 Tax=Carpinus fangiana TaxID=176857 RepID=A0A5N6L6E6_9ROSI|nr:hypothetical protein FH972_027248 [Carpinus fangiana]
MASKTNSLPQPLELVIGEIGCGDGNGGGGVWFWKVFGGGGFRGWRRKRKRNMLLLADFWFRFVVWERGRAQCALRVREMEKKMKR